MKWSFPALGPILAGIATVLVLSGAASTDPRTPPPLPGHSTPFFGVAIVGSGGPAGAVDAYGDLIDLRAPGPAGRPLVSVSAASQVAGSVPREAVDVARAWFGTRWVPFWRAHSIHQRYVAGTNVLITVARVAGARRTNVRALGARDEIDADRLWLSRARPLNAAAPAWAHRLYLRSLLVLRALTDRRTGAVAAGARDGWAYVWPRDASAVAMALASAGYRREARQVVRFLHRLDLGAAARFQGDGTPVEGRAAQGDATGWVDAAARAVGLDGHVSPEPWRDRADYQEGDAGDYLGNAIASAAAGRIRGEFGTAGMLMRVADDSRSGIDSAAAWAVRPFARSALYPLARRTLLRIAGESGRYGILPSANWDGGIDPWTAPTAWTAWSLAALGEKRAALRLMAELHRDQTPLGLLPERVDARTGIPTSTTPLAWSHAFAILALRQLWPRTASNSLPAR